MLVIHGLGVLFFFFWQKQFLCELAENLVQESFSSFKKEYVHFLIFLILSYLLYVTVNKYIYKGEKL